MDFLGALPFIGLAVAWLAYGLMKALEHQDAADRSRSVDRFSHTMRVLARREPAGKRETRLVRTGEQVPREAPQPVAEQRSPAKAPEVPALDETGAPLLPEHRFVRRSAAAVAARRRRRVLGAILVLNALVASFAVGHLLSWLWQAAPVILLVAWLVACRKMVVRERAARRPAARTAAKAQAAAPAPVEDAAFDADATAEVPVVPAGPAGSIADDETSSWAPVPVTLPTYVSKPAAHRTVSAIDLDSTGVWTSGNTASDSALAREADAVRAAAQQQAPVAERRATGS